MRLWIVVVVVNVVVYNKPAWNTRTAGKATADYIVAHHLFVELLGTRLFSDGNIKLLFCNVYHFIKRIGSHLFPVQLFFQQGYFLLLISNSNLLLFGIFTLFHLLKVVRILPFTPWQVMNTLMNQHPGIDSGTAYSILFRQY